MPSSFAETSSLSPFRCSDTTACVALAAPVEQPLLQEWLLEMGGLAVGTLHMVMQSAGFLEIHAFQSGFDDWITGQSEVFQIVQQSASQDLGDRMLKAMQDAMQAGASQVICAGDLQFSCPEYLQT